MGFGSGHWVYAALTAGVTAADPFNTQPEASNRPMKFDRLQCVLRTGGVKTATGSEQWTDQQLIAPYQQQQKSGEQSLQNRASGYAKLRSGPLYIGLSEQVEIKAVNSLI